MQPGRVITAGAVCLSALAARSAEARRYNLVPEESRILLHVEKAGLFKGFGHEHVIAARRFSGYVDLDETSPTNSGVALTVAARSLQVLQKGEPPKDPPMVQKTMLGPKVLDAQRYPHITVTSTRATPTPATPQTYRVDLVCDVEVHGVVRPIRFPLEVEVLGDRIVARGQMTLRQTDFGIRPISVAGGTIRVKDEIPVEFTLVGRAQPSPAG